MNLEQYLSKLLEYFLKLESFSLKDSMFLNKKMVSLNLNFSYFSINCFSLEAVLNEDKTIKELSLYFVSNVGVDFFMTLIRSMGIQLKYYKKIRL